MKPNHSAFLRIYLQRAVPIANSMDLIRDHRKALACMMRAKFPSKILILFKLTFDGHHTVLCRTVTPGLMKEPWWDAIGKLTRWKAAFVIALVH